MHRHHPLQHGRICYSIGTPIWLAYVHHNNTAKFDEISILHNNGYLINKPASFSDEGNSLAAARESARPTKPGQELLGVIVTQVNEGYRRMNLLRLRTCDWIQNSKLHGSRRVIRELWWRHECHYRGVFSLRHNICVNSSEAEEATTEELGYKHGMDILITVKQPESNKSDIIY